MFEALKPGIRRALALAALLAALPCAATAEDAGSVFDLITGAYAPPSAAPSALPSPSSAPGLIGSAAAAMPAAPTGDVSAGEFSLLILVNRDNPVPEGLQPVLVDIGGGFSVDERCRDDLLLMLDDCRAAGLEPVVCSAYRTCEYQAGLFENKIERLVAEGVDAELAPALAMTEVALPGTSEHQLGLALDIVDADYQLLDEAQQHTPVQRWLIDNSYRYGFILRYPVDRSELTGIIYEPWHYRYVGRDAAAQIYASGLCLEEFLGAAASPTPGASPMPGASSMPGATPAPTPAHT